MTGSQAEGGLPYSRHSTTAQARPPPLRRLSDISSPGQSCSLAGHRVNGETLGWGCSPARCPGSWDRPDPPEISSGGHYLRTGLWKMWPGKGQLRATST